MANPGTGDNSPVAVFNAPNNSAPLPMQEKPITKVTFTQNQ
jgi:hypothetical protein